MKFRLILIAITARLFAAEPAIITLDVQNIRAEHFMGLGVQIDPFEYPPSAAAWKQTLERIDHMHPAFFRVMWRADPYCLGFDSAGNPRYVWNQGETTATQRLQPLYSILDYAQSRSIDVMLGEWDPPKGLGITGPQDPRWARIISDFVGYLTVRRHYTVIRYYNYMNEPNGNWMWPEGKVDYAAWVDGMRNLRSEFDRHGLKSLPIAGPDNSGDWDWIDRCARDLPRQIGLWDMHWYVKDKELLDGSIESLLSSKREMLLRAGSDVASKGLYLAEAGVIQGRVNGDQQPRVKTFDYGVLMADLVAQVARAGWMGASAWDLDDAMHVVNGRQHPAIPDDLTLKVWGFWNTQGAAMGHPEDESIRPWFYTWSLMSRLFPKGARVIAGDAAGAEGLRVIGSAWREGNKDRLAIMIVNEIDQPRDLVVQMPGGGRRPIDWYRYFRDDIPVDGDGYPVPASSVKGADLERGVKASMPARGVVFLQAR